MQDVRCVDLLQSVEKRMENAFDYRLRQASFPPAVRRQGFTLLELHDDIGGAIGFEKVVHMHDGRSMRQARDRLGLVEKPRSSQAVRASTTVPPLLVQDCADSR